MSIGASLLAVTAREPSADSVQFRSQQFSLEGRRRCFLQMDSLPVENDFCQSETDKRLCNFGACYNCFFTRIPLK